MSKSLSVTFNATLAFVLITVIPSDGQSIAQAETSADNSMAQKAVLVTGASSGLGRAITELLASNGYFVYAGARKDKDLADLNNIHNVQSIRLDVTSQKDIDAAVELITAAGGGLYGLVNIGHRRKPAVRNVQHEQACPRGIHGCSGGRVAPLRCPGQRHRA